MMANDVSKTKTKRPSRGAAKHTRRLKQAARKEVGTNAPQPKPAPVQKKPAGS